MDLNSNGYNHYHTIYVFFADTNACMYNSYVLQHVRWCIPTPKTVSQAQQMRLHSGKSWLSATVSGAYGMRNDNPPNSGLYTYKIIGWTLGTLGPQYISVMFGVV